MDTDKRKIYQDAIKEVFVLRGLLAELEKRINNLYYKIDEKLDYQEDEGEANRENQRENENTG